MLAFESIYKGNTNSWLCVTGMLPFPSASLGIIDYSAGKGFRDHIALLFHFTDGETENYRVEATSLRF